MPKASCDVPNFMDEQWIATIATVDAKGEPHAVPVWFTFDHEMIHVQTDRKSVKVRNIQRNPHVSIAVYNAHDEAVVVRGQAKIVDNEKKFKRLTQAHIDKYNHLHNAAHSTSGIQYIKLDAQGRDSMGIPLFDYQVRCIIEVKPEKILFW